ncbi:MAG TPA: tetratricopeptide repeat protein [Blastocatellia bacterium]|nr:tetratricopeptide repeat protein [Blastocatellia bacterium]
MQQSESPGGKLLSIAPITLLVLIVMLVNVAAQTRPEELKPGQMIERELSAAESHSYRVALTAGQYLNVAAEQVGINVEVSLADPSGRAIVSRDWWWREGTESVWALAESTGDYTLKISASNQPVESGKYRVKIEKIGDWQQASAAEKDLITAHKLSAEGEALLTQGTADSLRQAGEKLQAALALWRQLKDGNAEAQTLSDLGAVQANSGKLKQAIEPTSQALALFRAAGNKRGEAVCLTTLSTVYNFSGEAQKALEYYNQALPLVRAIKDYLTEADAASGFGLLLNQLGQTQRALETLNELALASRARGLIDGEAVAHNNMGLIYIGQGRLREAVEHYSQTLALLQKSSDNVGRSATLNNIGNAYTRMGEFQKALGFLLQGLEMARLTGDRRRETITLSSIGYLYIRLGDYERALQYYNQSLPLCRSLGLRDSEQTALNNLGSIYENMGDLPKARDSFNQSLTLAVSLGLRNGEASSLAGLASISNRLGDRQKALEDYDQALRIRREIGDQYSESYVLWAVGGVHAQLGNQQQALAYFDQALTLARSIGDHNGEAATLYQLARIERARGHATEARAQIEAALAIVESTRTNVSLNDVRATYFASRQDFYDFYIDLLMQAYKSEHDPKTLAEALRANERRSARSLLDSLGESRADIRAGVAPELLEREHHLQQDLSAKADQQLRLLSRKHTPAQAEALSKEIEALATEYEQALAQIRQTSPRYAAVTQPAPLDLKQIQAEVLDPQTLLLEYALGEERSYVWAVTQTSIEGYELPKRAEIEALARQVYDLLVAKADALYPEALAALSRMLLNPVADHLGRKRLVIVSDGTLQYIPFAALPAPASSATGHASLAPDRRANDKGQVTNDRPRPLIVEHEIMSLPSASVLAVLRRELDKRPPAPKAVAVLADPVFDQDDQRVRSQAKAQPLGGQGEKEKATAKVALPADVERSTKELGFTHFDRLMFSRREAEQITALAADGQPLKALDFAASRKTAAGLDQYRVIHFATHSLLNNQHPELSGIVLSLVDEQGQPQDGFLRLYEIYNLKLSADLAVLSACRTALGKEIKGEGLVGLTRGFMYAGVPRVTASLWKVSDRATAELMRRFYQKMLKEGLRPAAALRSAQLSMLKERQWAVPYYWAGFVIQGEWR